MMCLHPISVRKWVDPSVTRYLRTSSGRLQTITCELPKKQINSYHLVPCGKCVACLSRRRNDWTYRLTKEKEFSDYTYFLTLTYDNDHIPIRFEDNIPYFVFRKEDLQKYLKRVRYFVSKISPVIQCNYYAVSEYGGIGKRPHYHMLFYVKNDNYLKYKKQIDMILRDTWQLGFTTIKPASPANIHYVTKYCVKGIDHQPDGCIDPVFVLASKKNFLGSSVLDTIDKQACYSEPVVFNNGMKQAMPRIYRDKLGFKGMNVPMSDTDPRISLRLEKRLRNLFEHSFPGGSESDFIMFAQEHLNKFEKQAIRRQLARNEKL